MLTAHALTKDTVNGSVFAQCKFENLGSRTIKAAYFQIQCYDADRKPLDSIDFSYQNLYITKSEIFGEKTLIPLPSNKTRFYTVTPLRIVYSGISVDGNEWTNEENKAFEAAIDKEIQISSLGELTEQYLQVLKKLCFQWRLHQILPVRKNGFILCGCQKVSLDNEKVCPACGVAFEDLFQLNNLQALKERKEKNTILPFEKKAEWNQAITVVCGIVILVGIIVILIDWLS